MIESLHTITVSRVEASGAWHVLRENKRKKNGEAMEARSCRQAVTVRDRLGSAETGGVPLWAELKSELGVAQCSETGAVRYYASHTRANTVTSRKRLAEALQMDPESCQFSNVFAEKVGDDIDADVDIFGLVNPLNVDEIFRILGLDVDIREIWQLVDDSVYWDAGYPNTLVTNCGRRDMALEMYSSGIFRSLSKYFPRTKRQSFSDFDPIWLGESGKFKKTHEWLNFPPPLAPKIGVLTGNSPESGITLVNEFLQSFRALFEANATDVSMPEIQMHSTPSMGLTMELVQREERVWHLIEQDIIQLLEAGCKIVTIPCNTTIYFAPKIKELCSAYGAEFVSIADACLPGLEIASDKQVGLVGISPVVNFDQGFSGYSDALTSAGFDAVPCDGTELAWDVKNLGDKITELNQPFQLFTRMVDRHFSDVNVVILALTEISLVYRDNRKGIRKRYADKVFIDPLLELSKFLLYRYVVKGVVNSRVCALPNDFPVDDTVRNLIFGEL